MEPLKLEIVYYFRAPRDHDFTNNIVRENCLYVELLLGGVVYYEGNTYKRGTLFAHTEGDWTVHDFPDKYPYRVLMIFFRNYDREKISLPHISRWKNLKTLDSFVEDSLDAFHRGEHLEFLRDYLFSTIVWNAVHGMEQDASEEVTHHNLLEIRKALAHPDCYYSGWPGLCRRAGYSPSYLKTLFKKAFDITPYQFHLNARIERARKALETSQDPIRQIANNTGFKNLESFYRAFKRIVGTSPAEYRSRHASTKIQVYNSFSDGSKNWIP